MLKPTSTHGRYIAYKQKAMIQLSVNTGPVTGYSVVMTNLMQSIQCMVKSKYTSAKYLESLAATGDPRDNLV